MLLTFAAFVAERNVRGIGNPRDRTQPNFAVLTDRLADYCSSLCMWESGSEFIKSTFSRQALPLIWDFAELAPFGGGSGSPGGAIEWIVAAVRSVADAVDQARVFRGSATSQPFADAVIDAVVTDPPHYDNGPYSNISDFFYVWLKRTLGSAFPEHFRGQSTPKKTEAVADASRHNGDKEEAVAAYEDMMARSLAAGGQFIQSVMLSAPEPDTGK